MGKLETCQLFGGGLLIGSRFRSRPAHSCDVTCVISPQSRHDLVAISGAIS